MERAVSLLVAENVRKVYGGRAVVDGVSISVSRGQITGLLGPNGAGKTTTFYMVVGAVRPDAGSIRLDGEDITRLPMHMRARRGIGYLAQEASIFRDLSVWDNVMAILEFRSLSRAERSEKCQGLLEELSLMHVKDSAGRALSGGERRRAEIARTLAGDPAFILLDEPFAGVDPIAVGEIQRIVDYLKEKGLGILITDHNVRETLSICDHTYVMNAGEILVEGGAEDIISNPEARKIYLGEDFEMTGPMGRKVAAAAVAAGVPPEALAGAPAAVQDALVEGAPAPAPPPVPEGAEAVPAPEAMGAPASAPPTKPSPGDEPTEEITVVREPLPGEEGGWSGRLSAWPPEPGRPLLEPEAAAPRAEEVPLGGDSIFGEPPARRPVVEDEEETEEPGGIRWPAPPSRGGGRS